MADLGSISFAHATSEYDSAAAFVLVDRPKSAALIKLVDGVVEVAPDTSYAVARFTGANSPETAYSKGLDRVQKGLDLMSILGRVDLLTKGVEDECLVSWRTDGNQRVRVIGTVTFRFDAPPAQIIVRDAEGNPVMPERTSPSHHPGFRYFRLSQATEDLYEAFRNMYLSFELILSSVHPPKPGERERDWLLRSLEEAEQDLNLSSVIRVEAAKVPERVLSEIYTQTRLPLFHAKADRLVLPPHESDSARRKVRGALDLLTKVVLTMSQKWLGVRRTGGGVFFGWVFRNARDLYNGSQVLALSDTKPFHKDQQDLSDERYQDAIEMQSAVKDDPDDRRAPIVYGEMSSESFAVLPLLTKIEVVKEDSPLSAHILESPMTLSNIGYVEFWGRTRIENVRQPKWRFAR